MRSKHVLSLLGIALRWSPLSRLFMICWSFNFGPHCLLASSSPSDPGSPDSISGADPGILLWVFQPIESPSLSLESPGSVPTL